MLDRQRAVLIKRGNSLLGRVELRVPWVVVALTNSIMACFAGPSFHEGRGSWARATPVLRTAMVMASLSVLSFLCFMIVASLVFCF